MTALTQDSFNFHHPRDCRMDSEARWGRIGAFWAVQTCRRRLAQEMQALRSMNDHLLRDIGLNRSEVGGADEHFYRSDTTIRILSGR
ncbi:DUF1127 domain-containing protein [Defluviimonas sp. D31]|uniref:DUF1127 domain-containing protein n=1 Tax=Defluviimonas sp. D31 TaxID=3083253 RepID=UPI00296E5AEC|nr:DUF1127 domain-containing protein [Defluviimonas sp. D31]MDW4551607.1 DUF1127 domain-containing protein [Defluviimonas sp. D31]